MGSPRGAWLALPLVALVGCSDVSISTSAPIERQKTGKADKPGACRHGTVDYCGKQSPDGCWCDSGCKGYGDCCADDYDQVCGGGPPPPPPPQSNTLQYKSYEVLFTNPLCQTYSYSSPVATADGTGQISAKPKNVYCSPGPDYDSSGNRPSSPQRRMLEWLDPLDAGDEVFLAYLSFSNKPVADELCDAAQRGVKVTMVLDTMDGKAQDLKACGATLLVRGHKGGIGYAHNKLVLINPKAPGPADADTDHMRMVFSSGNLSSGIVVHHENWHFIEVRRQTYFAEAHLCLMEAQLDSSASAGTSAYRSFMNSCRSQIAAPEEEDITAYFIPNADDSKALTDRMVDSIKAAKKISIAAHRFGNTKMISALKSRLASPDVKVRMVADDDLYWLMPYGGGAGAEVGNNMMFEAYNVSSLYKAGGYGQRFEIRYLETNHAMHLLHHNKFLLFEELDGEPDAVLCGAANLTNTGFWDNLENIYIVEVPVVVQAFRTQFARFWEGKKASPDEQEPPVATPPEKMPAQDITP